jgi:hypothetical protein
LKAKHAAIKGQRAIDIGHFEMNVSDANTGIDGRIAHLFASVQRCVCQLAFAAALRVNGATRSAVMRFLDLRRT